MSNNTAMLWVLYIFVSGLSYFVGAGLILLSVVTSLGNKVFRIMGRIGVLLGGIFVVLSSVPLPLWCYVCWSVMGLMGLVAGIRKDNRLLRLNRWLLTGFTLIMIIGEIPHSVYPAKDSQSCRGLIVIGDSISAGIGGQAEQTWPSLVTRQTGMKVVNLAVAGATAKSAIKQAETIPVENDNYLVILEIGGNDLLGNTPVDSFATDLENLVQRIQNQGNYQIIMLELPLPPFKNYFGRIQRDLAGKYDIRLIPRRCFASVLCSPDTTSDGIHLSSKGHELMAGMITETVIK